MCGIYCHISSQDCDCSCAEQLQRRGPDAFDKWQTIVDNKIKIEFEGYVLHIRGNAVVTQPLMNNSGNVLLWNGEIYNGLQINDDENDTLRLFHYLNQASNADDLLNVISKIKGPWAFIYWQNETKKLWFGRDVFGRRSLLWRTLSDLASTKRCITISSILKAENMSHKCHEVPATGVFSLNVETLVEGKLLLQHHKWFPRSCSLPDRFYSSSVQTVVSENAASKEIIKNDHHLKNQSITDIYGVIYGTVPNILHNPELNSALPIDTDLKMYEEVAKDFSIPTELDETVATFLDVLNHAVEVRVKNNTKFCKLCEKVYLQKLQSCLETDGLLGTCSAGVSDGNLFKKDLENVEIECNLGSSNVSDKWCCKHCKVAILFSGGVDSCILAALADKHIPLDTPIDLLNVAFEDLKSRKQKPCKFSKGVIQSDKASTNSLYDVPDRKTGLDALSELQTLSPLRHWNFVEINISIEELQMKRHSNIASLLFSSNTVLDDSIGSALWFASRGCGKILGQEEPYQTPAKVLLLGMGADEQLGGYSRHRVKFKQDSWKGLLEELSMEMERISSRNLGRDDRIISDHGREARFPFLDEDLVSFLNGLPVWYKTNLDLPRGIGEKILLRLAAKSLGLKRSASFPKRAIQFGSRIAKAENNSEKGSDICVR